MSKPGIELDPWDLVGALHRPRARIEVNQLHLLLPAGERVANS